MVGIVIAIGFVAFMVWVVDTLTAVRRSQIEILVRLARLEQVPPHFPYRALPNEELKLPAPPSRLVE